MPDAVRRTALLLVVTVPAAVGSAAAGRPAPAIRRSDVVFMYDNPALYGAYGTTVLGWAGRANAEHIRAAHAAGVRLFSCSVGFLTEGRGVIDFSEDFLDAACRDIAGEPFIVPWLWDHSHKGQKFYWWCTNSPLYRRYLQQRLKQTVATGCDGLHIDDYRGTSGSITWLGGGFCRHCMAAFRKYLAAHVAPGRLAELGIRDIATFDYRRFLLDRGVKPAEYTRVRARLPLAKEFLDFHVRAADAFVAAYHKRACELAGRKLTLSVNSGLSNPHALFVAPHLDYFCCEVRHDAPRRRCPTHPVSVYKLGEALGPRICATASGQDWAFVAENRTYELVRTWIAMSYAFGQNFMAPHRQWCYTKQKGTHWTEGPTDRYAPLYRFVRARAELLDGYEAVAPVLVVYDNAANRRGQGRIESVCADLAGANIPFAVAVAGDDWLADYRLRPEDLAAARAVVLPKGARPAGPQGQALDAAEKAGKVLTWPDPTGLERLLPAPVRIEGAENVWAVPRRHPARPSAPAVLHLLNRNYNPAADRVVPKDNLTVHIRAGLFPGRAFTRAALYAPGQAPAEAAVRREEGGWRVAVGRLGLWTIVALTDRRPPAGAGHSGTGR